MGLLRSGSRRRLAAICAALVGVMGLATAAAAVPPERTSAKTATRTTEPGDVTARVDTDTSTRVEVPPDVTAGIAVYDRETGEFTEQLNQDAQFRSASVVKLLLVLDFLWDRGPAYDLSDEDRARMDVMLRSSDDDAATYYWTQLGGSAVIDRMVERLGLTNTTGPPADYPGYWGYSAFTAADTVRIYRYVLDEAPAPVRDYIMGNLHASTRCASDTFDQHFGIPAAFEQPWSAKQGWSGFDSGGCSVGAESTTVASDPTSTPNSGNSGNAEIVEDAAPEDLDLTSEALHTTGTVGENDRSIIAVYTLHPDGTPYATAYSKLNALALSLNVPGAAKLPGKAFGTWGEGVNVRAEPNTQSDVVAQVPSDVEVLVSCQVRGELVEVPPHSNDWWAYLPQYGGYMTNVYVDNDSDQLPDVPEC